MPIPSPQRLQSWSLPPGMRATRATRALAAVYQARPDAALSEPEVETALAQAGVAVNKVTVYRMLQRLGSKGIIRRLGLHERSAYFTLLIPGTHKDYLICTECNHIEPIQAPCPVHALEREIAEKSGYQKLYHELEFFGICPNCSPS